MINNLLGERHNCVKLAGQHSVAFSRSEDDGFEHCPQIVKCEHTHLAANEVKTLALVMVPMRAVIALSLLYDDHVVLNA